MLTMTDKIPQNVKKIYSTLKENNYEVYLVGGCVRNLLMEIPVKDWDLTTNATPDEIQKLFENSFYNNEFGTVGIQLDGVGIVEITTFRTEHGFSNKRHPDSISWGKTIEEDLSRRDFTMNAIALPIINNQSSINNIVDPYHGQADIKIKSIKTVGDPRARFKEDALRLMRAVRFATQLTFEIEKDTWKEIKTDASLIQNVSFERIRDELMKILTSENASYGIMLLKEAGLLEHIIPELLEGVGVSQVRPGRHHKTDVFTHNLLSLKYVPSTDPIVRFAALLHDVGKPKVRGEDKEGLVTFYNHEIKGAKIAYEICERLKLSKKEKERVVNLIRWHMFSVDEHNTDASIRRFIRKVGTENVKDLIDLRVGDRLGSGTKPESWRLNKFKERIEEQLKPAPFSINDLAIDGNDIMRELKLKPGKKIGEILQRLFEEVDEDLSKNTKEYLIERIHKL